jgi:HlyD family secretion protein
VAATERDRARADLDRTTAQLQSADAQRRAGDASATAAVAAIATAQAEVGVAAATILQRQSALDRARLDLERTEIRAPIQGVVIERNVEVGQTVAASLQAPVLFTIARDIEEMRIELFVDEADIGSLREGQRVEFRVAAHAGRVFAGEIIQLRLAPMLIQNVVTYVAMLSAPNPERLLRPGMTATVRVDVEERADVLRVPNAALRFRPQREERVDKLPGRRPGGRTGVVHVETREGLREVAVDLGLVDERFTEIRGGLDPGAVVVTGYR